MIKSRFATIGAILLILVAGFGTTLAVEPDRVFESVDSNVAKVLASAIEEKYSVGIKPIGNLRHRFVKIDSKLLIRELRKSYTATKQGDERYVVTINLFDERAVEVSISEQVYGDFDTYFIRGTVLGVDATEYSATFQFSEDYLRKIAIDTQDRWYRIDPANDDASYYVVFESKYVSAEM